MDVNKPTYDIDFYGDELIADPYPHYQAMRDLAPAVWLAANRGWAITRFADVRDALRNAEVFVSGRGVMMNEATNQAAAGTSILCMDEPGHMALRQIMMRPLMPAALNVVQGEMDRICRELVDHLVIRGVFDGVTEFAHVLPLMLVTRMVGLPEDGREQMLDWATGIFNVMGNDNGRFRLGLASRDLAMHYLAAVRRESLLPDSLGARLFALVDQGVIDEARARSMLFDYVAPALDTTINATSAVMWLFGQHPDQWALARAEPALMSAAIDEAMRLETPIRAFSRELARDHQLGGVTLGAGSRALIVYASANRDERRWQNPNEFDITRQATRDQMAFGTGLHMCVGMHLARLEMLCLFNALAARVVRFEVGDMHRDLHNVLRGLARVDIRITEAT